MASFKSFYFVFYALHFVVLYLSCLILIGVGCVMLLSQTDMSPWLQAKPDLKKVGEVRRTIKGLRSRLRHRLADKKDLEEVSSKHSAKCKVV